MESTRQESGWARKQLAAVVVLLVAYNAVYWTGRFAPEWLPAIAALRSTLVAHWGLLTFLEFLGVAALFADVVIRWDDFTVRVARIRLAIAVVLTGAFVARTGFAVMDLYLAGYVR